MADATLLAVVLVLGPGGGLLLYVAVRAEASQRETMSRAVAERVARLDTGDERAGGRRRRGDAGRESGRSDGHVGDSGRGPDEPSR